MGKIMLGLCELENSQLAEINPHLRLACEALAVPSRD
jgi:hypothetical protein